MQFKMSPVGNADLRSLPVIRLPRLEAEKHWMAATSFCYNNKLAVSEFVIQNEKQPNPRCSIS